ncbi:MAG: sigma-54-dependent Fis family transcriptional regulator [Bacteroidia bacterium]|nr:sigma-54-dependent Fis family transcriptional regulator [Bacteroidia bacterium]
MIRESESILIIDDDDDVLQTVRLVLKRKFPRIRTATDPGLAIPTLKGGQIPVVLLDMNFTTGAIGGKEGLHWLREIKKLSPQTQVIMMTAYGEIPLAVQAMKDGATDFVAKPWNNDELLEKVQLAYETGQSGRDKSPSYPGKALGRDPFLEMIGDSPAMKRVMDTIAKVAGTEVNVLILGENGTGKEVAARALHRMSGRNDEVFVKVDLGSIPATLFESELFGHKKGAFTDAAADRAGRFEAAQGGTLFLDEIGNLPMSLQAKLLSALQNRQITRVGSNESIPIDVRLISATNMPLHQMVEEKIFRQDLLYRLNTVELKLPPLRERTEDIPELLQHYFGLYTKKYQRDGLELAGGTVKKLREYHWPGNIRELQHAIERAVIMSDGKFVLPEDFQLQESRPENTFSLQDDLNLEEVEKVAIQNAIRKHDGNLSKAARELGLGRTTLYRKMSKYDL